MEKSTKTVETEKGTIPGAEAMPFAASWDVFYQDAQGLECHLQLKGITLDAVLADAKSASMSITESGGKPSRRMAGNSHGAAHIVDKPKENGSGNGKGSANGSDSSAGNGSFREPSYVDERGARRCNRKLSDGSVCGRPVTEKEGRYGAFWSCPNYKSHAPAPAPAR